MQQTWRLAGYNFILYLQKGSHMTYLFSEIGFSMCTCNARFIHEFLICDNL